MTDLFMSGEDATPLTPDEREGLLQSWITTRADLNIAEQDNIDAAAAWVLKARKARLLSSEFTNRLHGRMFGNVWSWAGKYRESEHNLGIAPHLIGSDMAQLFDDAQYWQENETYEPDELAIRLHHRLVAIHPYPNGNGRLSRMMADLLIRELGGDPFTWGSRTSGGNIGDMSNLRQTYIMALKAADNHNAEPLIMFARA